MVNKSLSGQMIGQYEIRDLLGKGGMAVVYQGYDTRLDREVAIKILLLELAHQPGYAERFMTEARIIASLEHPHIAPVYDYGIHENLSYFVMRLLTGGTLSERIIEHQKTGTVYPLDQILRLLNQLADALDFAHGKGVLQRDIKPSNVMFDSRDDAYLMDFGVAKLVSEARSSTSSGIILGTPVFMAPEQWRAESLSPASDQYSLAMTIYALVAGRTAFEAPTPHALMYMHLSENPPPPHDFRADIPEGVSSVLLRALAKDPHERFPNITQFAQAFEAAILGKQESPHIGKHIFLSYSRDDSAFMQHLRDYLLAQDFEVWTDEQLAPGTPVWEVAIGNAIEKASALIVVLSPDAKESTWVTRELSYAEDHGITIYPILLRGSEKTAVPFRLVSTQRIDARTDFDAAMQQLVTALRDHLSA
jgi:serine/threonine protein kinase